MCSAPKAYAGLEIKAMIRILRERFFFFLKHSAITFEHNCIPVLYHLVYFNACYSMAHLYLDLFHHEGDSSALCSRAKMLSRDVTL